MQRNIIMDRVRVNDNLEFGKMEIGETKSWTGRQQMDSFETSKFVSAHAATIIKI